MNSECASDEYCCRKKETIGNLGDNCAKSCIWKNCASDDDCGEPDLCCISNKCVDRVLVVLRTRIAMSVYLTNTSVARRPFLSTKLSVAMIVSVKLVTRMTTALEEENAVVRTNALTHATKGLLLPRKTQPPPHKTKAPSTNPSSRVHLQGELLVLQ